MYIMLCNKAAFNTNKQCRWGQGQEAHWWGQALDRMGATVTDGGSAGVQSFQIFSVSVAVDGIQPFGHTRECQHRRKKSHTTYDGCLFYDITDPGMSGGKSHHV